MSAQEKPKPKKEILEFDDPASGEIMLVKIAIGCTAQFFARSSGSGQIQFAVLKPHKGQLRLTDRKGIELIEKDQVGKVFADWMETACTANERWVENRASGSSELKRYPIDKIPRTPRGKFPYYIQITHPAEVSA